MSHDPLCPSLGKGVLPVIDLCACRLIARVREDEFAYKGDIDTAYGQGWDEALDAAREAVARLQHKPGANIANAVSAIDALVRNYMANSQEPAYNNPQGVDDGER